MSIWIECEGLKFFKYLELEPWRIVEDQYSSSSRDLVESSEEHDLLEKLLDDSKPQAANNKHYLIFTPFRYPPLEYGSRFGNIYEPSLWYGSLTQKTAFAEVAFYRLKFFDDTVANLGYIEIRMTAFKAYIQTKNGIDLTKSPFQKYQDKISSKTNYEQSQLLGTEMREAKVEAFIFASARDKNAGENVAAFTPDVFKIKNKEYITNMQNWRCIANKNVIEFSRDDILQRKKLEFSKAEFEELSHVN
ncbi:RES family NAD+ phosphorylase [Legionella bozemanae]|uniref:RES family NAD+ phosphorylase n=1 Tax=Legionella bozemanae TaxID=447 RepID=UPI0010414760|nr:RES family NAD+ phosphorylase [Legionella bozemanae]